MRVSSGSSHNKHLEQMHPYPPHASNGHYIQGPQYTQSGQYSAPTNQYQQTGQYSQQTGQYSQQTGQYSQQTGQYSQQPPQQHTTSYTTQTYSAGTNDRRQVTDASVISEKIIEHEIKIPRKVVREELVEKVVVVPETIYHEEIVEDVQKVREKIIEIAKPVIKKVPVEVPYREYVEKIVEVPEYVYKHVTKVVPVVEYRDKIVENIIPVTVEKIVEVPEIQYREVPVERTVEVPVIKEEVVYKEVPVPQYVDKPVPEYVTVEIPEDIDRVIPVPVEATTTFEFLLPKLKPKYEKVVLPIYAPRFVEVPMPAELIDAQMLQQAEHLSQQVSMLAAQQAPSLCEIERLAEYAKSSQFQANLSQTNLQAAVEEAWRSGTLQISHQHGQPGVARV